ncbi:MAG: hypothetical protein RR307_05470 [Clostridia bacterium]
MRFTLNKKFIATLIALVMTVALATTTTFAWFSKNTIVTVGDFQSQVTANKGLEISADGINYHSTLSQEDLFAANAYLKNIQLQACTPQLDSTNTLYNGNIILDKKLEQGNIYAYVKADQGDYITFKLYFRSDVAMNVKIDSLDINSVSPITAVYDSANWDINLSQYTDNDISGLSSAQITANAAAKTAFSALLTEFNALTAAYDSADALNNLKTVYDTTKIQSFTTVETAVATLTTEITTLENNKTNIENVMNKIHFLNIAVSNKNGIATAITDLETATKALDSTITMAATEDATAANTAINQARGAIESLYTKLNTAITSLETAAKVIDSKIEFVKNSDTYGEIIIAASKAKDQSDKLLKLNVDTINNAIKTYKTATNNTTLVDNSATVTAATTVLSSVDFKADLTAKYNLVKTAVATMVTNYNASTIGKTITDSTSTVIISDLASVKTLLTTVDTMIKDNGSDVFGLIATFGTIMKGNRIPASAANATRVAFKNVDAGSAWSIYDINAALGFNKDNLARNHYNYEIGYNKGADIDTEWENAKDDTAIKAFRAKYPNYITKSDVVQAATLTALATTEMLTLTKVGDHYEGAIEVMIWIEGKDGDAFNSILRDKFATKFRFFGTAV